MPTRSVGILMTPQEVHEAKGLTLRRTIGSDKLVLLDPFLLLDHMSVGPVEAGSEPQEIGFAMHPHRGIETLTYVMAGNVRHRDTMGNTDTIGPWESQWMTAGGGLFHEEMVQVTEEGHEGLQIWFNLPAQEKLKPPAYRSARYSDIPIVTQAGGAVIRVVAGTVDGVFGAFEGIAVQPTYLDVQLPPGATATLPAPPGQNAFAFTYKGDVHYGDPDTKTEAVRYTLAIFAEGDGVQATAPPDEEARLIFVAAQPLNEPVLQYRSIVMNTVDQMKQALDDLKHNTFAQ